MSFVTKWYGQQIKGAERAGAVQGLTDAIEHMLEAADRTIPHNEGIMQDSGSTSVDESTLTATVFYDTPYAVRQHEDLTMRHPNGRRAKWLELTMQERAEAVRAYLQRAINQRLGG